MEEQTLCRTLSQKKQHKFPNLSLSLEDAEHTEKARPTIWDDSRMGKIYFLNRSTVDLH